MFRAAGKAARGGGDENELCVGQQATQRPALLAACRELALQVLVDAKCKCRHGRPQVVYGGHCW